jgi:hypothetical protein
MINLNDDSFDGGSNVKIFNNGTAGVVENVKLSVKKKTAEDKENAPDYKIIYTDNTGAEVNTAYWYVTEATEYSTLEEQIKKQGKVLKHLVHAVYGSDYEFPSYPNPTAMLDGVMKLLKAEAGSSTYRVFANYGSTMGVKSYIQVRSWVPFIEPMTVTSDASRLQAGNIDAMERLTEDTVSSNGVATASVSDGDDW